MKDKVLKKITVGSFVLLFLVILASFLMQIIVTDPTDGRGEEITDGQKGKNNNKEDGIFAQITNSEKAGAWYNIPGMEESLLIELNGSDAIIIEKPADAEILVEDLAVDRKLRATITGLGRDNYTGSIYRIRNDTLYSEPIPTPTATLTPSPTPVPNNNTEIENTSEGQIIVQRTPAGIGDPVNSVVKTIVDAELNESVTVELEFHLDKTYVYEFREDEQYLYIILKRPKDVYDKILVVDAGHGFGDSGTYSAGYEYLEKDMNLNILLYVKELFDEQDDIKVYYTRTTDRRLTLNQRVDLANNLEADLFVSIHCNSNPSSSIRGTEVLYNENQGKSAMFNSEMFAQICADEVSSEFGLTNRGIIPRSSNVHIIGAATMPVALIEMAYMTNSYDLEVLRNESSQRAAARGVYNAVIKAYGLLNGGTYE